MDGRGRHTLTQTPFYAGSRRGDDQGRPNRPPEGRAIRRCV